MIHKMIKGEAQTARRLPELPALARIPWSCLPAPVRVGVLTRVLNFLFAAALCERELDFLDGRIVNIHVADAGIEFSIGKDCNKLVASPPATGADLFIEGTAYTFMLLASGEEDADTLFFRRQLKTSGDTELGLFVKNFLSGLEVDRLPLNRIADPLLHGGLRIAERSVDVSRRISRMMSVTRWPRAETRTPDTTLHVNNTEIAT